GVHMIPIPCKENVVLPHRRHEPRGHGLLAGVQMQVAANLPAPEGAFGLLLEPPNKHHLAVPVQHDLRCHLGNSRLGHLFVHPDSSRTVDNRSGFDLRSAYSLRDRLLPSGSAPLTPDAGPRPSGYFSPLLKFIPPEVAAAAPARGPPSEACPLRVRGFPAGRPA